MEPHTFAIDGNDLVSISQFCEEISAGLSPDKPFSTVSELEIALKHTGRSTVIVWQNHDVSLSKFGLTFTSILKVFKKYEPKVILKLR